MTEGLLRQRRNLIICCALLWMMKYGGVNFTKFSLAGFDVSLQKPEALTIAVWIAFGYFLYRYYQYFSDEGVEKLTSTFVASRDEKCQPIMQALVLKEHPDCIDVDERFKYSHLKSWEWIFPVQKLKSGSALGEHEISNMPISKWKLSKGVLYACLDTTFRNSVVTDYLLPFFLADFILWYCGSNDWKGSFLQLFFS